MTNPVDRYQVADTRRHSDPAILWVLVLAGSLLVHLVVILGIQLFSRQTRSVHVDPTPVSVEFLDTDPALFSTPSGQSVGSTPPKATSEQTSFGQTSSSPTSQPASESSPPQDQLLPESSQAGSQQFERSPTIQSPSTNTPLRRSKISASSSSTDSSPTKSGVSPTDSPPTDSPPTKSPADKLAPPNTSTSSNTPNDPLESGIPLPNLPPVPDPADNLGLNNQNTVPSIKPFSISQNSVPASFFVQIKRTASANASDRPDHPATIQGESSKTFSSNASGCLLTPAAFRSFKQPVVLSVPLDENGKIDEQQPIRIQQSSSNNSYDQLTICAVKSWSFIPAYNLENGSKLYKPSYLDLEVITTSVTSN